MIDLQTLGQRLRERRRSLRIPSAELARRIGVSPTYVWLIERARPRSGGEPSRPGEEVLDRWMAALGTNEADARALRALAGYFDPNEMAGQSVAIGKAAPFTSMPAMASSPDSLHRLRRSETAMFAAPSDALQQWADRGDVQDITSELHALLDLAFAAANRAGRTDEAAVLLGSFLRWLAQFVDEER